MVVEAGRVQLASGEGLLAACKHGRGRHVAGQSQCASSGLSLFLQSHQCQQGAPLHLILISLPKAPTSHTDLGLGLSSTGALGDIIQLIASSIP